MKSTSSDAGRPPDSKAVLFCFDCGHESPLEGDWNVEQRDDREAYRCPECGTTISVRPDQNADTGTDSNSDSDSRAAETNGGREYCIGD